MIDMPMLQALHTGTPVRHTPRRRNPNEIAAHVTPRPRSPG